MTNLIALHKHWVAADSIQQFMLKEIPISDPVARLPAEFQQAAQAHSKILRLYTFYALLYVVVEGYQNLSLRDDALDRLLKKTHHVEALRRFRNAIFHYQEDPRHPNLTKFMIAKDSDKWIRAVYDAFQEFFEENLSVKETIEHLKEYGPLSEI